MGHPPAPRYFASGDAGAVYNYAVGHGAEPRAGPIGPVELSIPAIRGIGSSLIYLVDRYDENIIYDVGFETLDVADGEGARQPAGLTYRPHCPHGKALAADPGNVDGKHDGIAVMMDTRDALEVAALPDGVEWLDYVNSWKDYLDKDISS